MKKFFGNFLKKKEVKDFDKTFMVDHKSMLEPRGNIQSKIGKIITESNHANMILEMEKNHRENFGNA